MHSPASTNLSATMRVATGCRIGTYLQRVTTSPENAVRIREATGDIEFSDLLASVKVPTLVLHCRDDAVIPFEEGRRLAAGIPGARFVALEGKNHVALETDPGFRRLVKEIEAFLKN
jgi:pimeloyl-ACP methyl ester carboxylesterase